MISERPIWEVLSADSFLEYAFLRWVVAQAVRPAIARHIVPQHEVTIAGHTYRVDYAFLGQERIIVVELDGFAFHGHRDAFTYDRLRQNNLQSLGWTVLRFSYDAIRLDTVRCVEQLQAVLRLDGIFTAYLVATPVVSVPDMDSNPITSLAPAPGRVHTMTESYFATVRPNLNLKTLRSCQTEAFAALSNYYGSGGTNAACVMSVGAGKTALGVVATLAFSRQRAMVVTPGSVIRGTFDKAFDHTTVGNVLYGLPGGPLIPGCQPPRVLTLDREDGPIRTVTPQTLREADVLITNFHSLGTGDDPDDLLAKLAPDDIDMIIVDEAHIAAADSYQRTFRRFKGARTLLMSACF
jgi:hypothetical protein